MIDTLLYLYTAQIDPILYTIQIGDFAIPIRWYGLLAVLGALSAAFYGAWYVRREDEDPVIVWDAVIWVLLSGIVGARLWYVVTETIEGNQQYINDPVSIIRVDQGGLNILGGIVIAVIVTYIYANRNRIDFWLLADAIAPGYLIGQAIGRIGNYINQELYGPPTDLPWGISIAAQNRIAPWNDLDRYPVAETLFHPTFAYEMIWNFIAVAIITYIVINHRDKIRTGVVAGMALFATGLGRALLEISFRPDQPEIPGTDISISLIVAILFAVVGLVFMLARWGTINVGFIPEGKEEYGKRITRRPPRRAPRTR